MAKGNSHFPDEGRIKSNAIENHKEVNERRALCVISCSLSRPRLKSRSTN